MSGQPEGWEGPPGCCLDFQAQTEWRGAAEAPTAHLLGKKNLSGVGGISMIQSSLLVPRTVHVRGLPRGSCGGFRSWGGSLGHGDGASAPGSGPVCGIAIVLTVIYSPHSKAGKPDEKEDLVRNQGKSPKDKRCVTESPD